MDIQIGTVSHYFDKLGVAVIDVTNQSLNVGDTIKFSGHDNEFTQTVDSLQMEHEKMEKVRKGDSCGMKVDKPVKEGDTLYLVSHS